MTDTMEGWVTHSPHSRSSPPHPQVPIWEKYTLTVEEAAAYFRIGENKLRQLVNEHPDAEYILWNGNRPQIKRIMFGKMIDSINAI
jgi:hypothetical protein